MTAAADHLATLRRSALGRLAAPVLAAGGGGSSRLRRRRRRRRRRGRRRRSAAAARRVGYGGGGGGGGSSCCSWSPPSRCSSSSGSCAPRGPPPARASASPRSASPRPRRPRTTRPSPRERVEADAVALSGAVQVAGTPATDVALAGLRRARTCSREWTRRLDDFDAQGLAQPRSGSWRAPSVEYVGMGNREATRRTASWCASRPRSTTTSRRARAADLPHGREQRTTLREYWTLAKRDGRWRLLSIEQDAEGAHHLDAADLATPWGDDARLRDASVTEIAVAERPPARSRRAGRPRVRGHGARGGADLRAGRPALRPAGPRGGRAARGRRRGRRRSTAPAPARGAGLPRRRRGAARSTATLATPASSSAAARVDGRDGRAPGGATRPAGDGRRRDRHRPPLRPAARHGGDARLGRARRSDSTRALAARPRRAPTRALAPGGGR